MIDIRDFAIFLAVLVVGFLGAIAIVFSRRDARGTEHSSRRDTDRMEVLENRVTAIERRLAELLSAGPVHEPASVRSPTAASTFTEPDAFPEKTEAPEASPASASRDAWVGAEALAGRWLNYVGIVALLLGVAFFLKYAFDNDWVGPSGRVAIGILAGVLLEIWSDRLLKRAYGFFSEGIAGLGAGVLFLSLYAAWDYYHLLPQSAVFIGMIAVTVSMAFVAKGRNSQRIALVALAGGYATPLLVSTGTDQQFILFSYLLVLNGGLLLMSEIQEWELLEWLAFLSTVAYYVGWCIEFYDITKLTPSAVWATLFFAQFAALPVLRSRAAGTLARRQMVLVVINAVWYLFVLRALLEPDHRWLLTIAVLALAAAHVAVARMLPAGPPTTDQQDASLCRLVFAGLALTFATLAIPIRLEGRWITMAWAVEGAVLVRTGFSNSIRVLRNAGLVLLGLAIARQFLPVADADRFLLNGRFATCLITVVCLGTGLLAARANWQTILETERSVFMLLGIAANGLLLWGLSLEVWESLARQTSLVAWDLQLLQQLGLSLLWVAYASVLTGIGFRFSFAGLRWQGLALFGLSVAKVFLYDLQGLERAYRIVSFIVLGAALLSASFYYQRKLGSRKTGNTLEKNT